MSGGEQRCLTCQNFDSGEPNPEAEERALEMRYGPEVALVGACRHPECPMTINTKFGCEDWQDGAPALPRPDET